MKNKWLIELTKKTLIYIYMNERKLRKPEKKFESFCKSFSVTDEIKNKAYKDIVTLINDKIIKLENAKERLENIKFEE